jgi:hypothetical protein
MPSVYQKASLNALLGLFLEAQGHPLPQHTQLKFASSLSRFLNHYTWSTRGVIRATRQATLKQIAEYLPRKGILLDFLTNSCYCHDDFFNLLGWAVTPPDFTQLILFNCLF